MKVLMIGPFPPVLNGVTISNDFLFTKLNKEGFSVTKINTETGLIASKQGDKLSISKILAFLSIYVHIFKVFGNSTVYMAIGQTFWGLTKYSPFIILCKVLGIPYVLHIHGGYVCQAYQKMTPFKKEIFRKLLQGSKSVIALSAGLADDLKNVFAKANVTVVENFYDPRLIENPIGRKEHPRPRFLFLSNLMLGKGILEFLDALYILKHHYKIDFEVALAGKPEKGIDKTLHTKMEAIRENIYFYGVADFEKKKELLYWSDVFVLPTWYIMEGQPLSIIEAYVTGNIVVSTHQGGIKEISNYDTFYKAEIQNPEMLAQLLVKVVKELPLSSLNIQKTSSQARDRFDPERFGQEIIDVL